MLDIDKIRELVQMMVAHDLVEISLRDGEEEVNLRRPNARAMPEALNGLAGAPSANPSYILAPQATSAALPPPAAAPAAPDAGLLEIKSPMVGTFYASPDPDSPPFVQAGAAVHVGTVVCILEAMKVFNEIKCEVAGTIERVLVKNAQAVEFGQPLFLVRPQ